MARVHLNIAVILKFFKERFWLAKLTRVPLLGRLIEYFLFDGDHLVYLPRAQTVRRIAVEEDLDEPTSVPISTAVVGEFIAQTDNLWRMNFCICRRANSCHHHPHDFGCLFLGPAATRIHPSLGQKVTKEVALKHVQRAAEHDLVALIGRNKLDTVWLNTRPKEELLTVCFCCSCCCLWRILPVVSATVAAGVQKMPGLQVTVGEACIGCGTCSQEVCFADAITLGEGRATISPHCRGCGRCVRVCPQQAIVLSMQAEDAVQRTTDHLGPLVRLE